MEGIIIGIDFGTTNTSIAYMKYDNYNDNYKPECFSFGGKDTMNSLITYKSKDEFWVGHDALIHSYEYPDGFIKSLKRQVINDDFSLYNNKSSIDVMADYFSHLFKRIEHQLPYDTFIESIVIGIPIGFKDKDKEIYTRALLKSGIYRDYETAVKNTIFISEPIAAVLNYNVSLKDDLRTLVFDFGGGTLDLVIMDLKNVRDKDEIKEHDVIAKKGNLRLGGDDFDRAILENIVMEKYGILKLKSDLKISSINDIFHVQEGIELMNQIRNAKEELSSYDFGKIVFQKGNLAMNIEINRREYELAIRDYLTEIKRTVIETLEEARLTSNDIDIVILSGGSSLTPSVQELLKEIFDSKKIRVGGDAMTSISRGLAWRGNDLEKSRYNDILEHNYGIKMKDEYSDRDIIGVVLKKGKKVNEINNEEFYQEFELREKVKTKNVFRVKVYENDDEIGVAHIPLVDQIKYSSFKLHFTIDDNSKRLELHIYDTKWGKKIEIPLEERYVELNPVN